MKNLPVAHKRSTNHRYQRSGHGAPEHRHARASVTSPPLAFAGCCTRQQRFESDASDQQNLQTRPSKSSAEITHVPARVSSVHLLLDLRLFFGGGLFASVSPGSLARSLSQAYLLTRVFWHRSPFEKHLIRKASGGPVLGRRGARLSTLRGTQISGDERLLIWEPMGG